MDKQNEILGKLFDAAETEAASESLFDHLMNVDLRYLQVNQVGSGSMKEIFRTEDRKTGRQVAMAVLKNHQDSKAVESFLREARINAQLQHPNIIPVYEIDLDEHERPYFTMKLVPGSSLKDIIAELGSGKKETIEKYTLPVLLDVFLKVCDAVAYAHSKGICHLDLKPDNIRVSNFGEVRVCDWGLANFIGEAELDGIDEDFQHYNSHYKTLQGQIKGTPGYMAPEQASAERELKDQRTDIFSLGCILYELLTFRVAIDGSNLEEVLKNTCSKEVSEPSEKYPHLSIPESLEAVCMKAVKINPDERYSKIEEVIKDIDSYRNGFATEAESPTLYKQIVLFYMRNSSFCIMAFLFLALLITITVFFVENLRNKERVAIEALTKLQKQQKVTTDALVQIRKEQEFREKISDDSSVAFALKAVASFKKENFGEAKEFAEITLLLDEKNLKAHSTIAKLKMIQQDYKSALQIMKDNPDPVEQEDLIIFCEAAKEYQEKNLDFKTLYELIETHIRPQRTPLINMMMKPVLAPYKKTDLLKEQLSWLIKKRNKISELNFDLKHSEGTFHVDISNNKELRNIFFLRILPIYELNISQTAIGDTKLLSEMDLNVLHIDSTPINNLRFVYLMQNLVQLHISQGSFPKNILNKLPDEIEIVEK